MARHARLRWWWTAVLLGLLGLGWLSALRFFFTPDREALVEPLLASQLALWSSPGDAGAQLRRTNPEWDLMGRTFTVLAFTNLSLARPERRGELLRVTDGILVDTLRIDAERRDAFVLPYFHGGPFRDPAARSLFVDGEVALMLAARQTASRAARFDAPLRERVDRIAGALGRGPVASAESYPDEVWTFCNAIALAALTLSDRLDGRDHASLGRRWVALARGRLIEPRTGLLLSSFSWTGQPREGPEGSSLWLVAHMLELTDEALAREQYFRARAALAHGALGFAWASEWPAMAPGRDDVDSGPTIPLVDANAGSSGLALVGAAAFHDEAFVEGLLTSLWFAAFPERSDGALRFLAGNPLGDAVVLYALVQGPLWALARPAAHREGPQVRR